MFVQCCIKCEERLLAVTGHLVTESLTMMFWAILLLPFLTEDATSLSLGCSLPAASTEKFNASTVVKPWYQQYAYEIPGLSWLGCLAYEQSPGATETELNLKGNFSRVSFFPLSARATFDGNRLNKVYEGVWDNLLTGPYNVVLTDEDFFIDHYCFLGFDVVQVFTTMKNPSDEVIERMWKIVSASPEVQESKLKRVNC